jgi:hypothetical protein
VSTDFNSPWYFENVLKPYLDSIGLGGLFGPQSRLGLDAGAGFRTDNRGNALNALGGPIFQNDPFGLPGNAAGVGASLNTLLQEVGSQQGRAEESEGLLRLLREQMGGGSLAQLNEQQIAGAAGLIDPNRFNDLRQQEENVVRGSAASQSNQANNILRDLGIGGQGAGGRDAALQASNLANQRLQSGLLDVSRQDEQRRNEALGLSSQLASGALGRQQALQEDPTLRLAQVLGGTQNVALPALIDSLMQTGNLQIGEAARSNKGSFFERGGLEASIAGLGALVSLINPPAGAAVNAGGQLVAGQVQG